METERRILIVDDEIRMRRSLADLLESHGYRTVGAADGQEAVNLLAAAQYELVLLDMVMPGMGGGQVLEHIRAHHPDVPVIVVTGFASAEFAVRKLREGAYDFIRKPYEHRELLSRIENALRYRSLNREKTAISKKLEISTAQYQYLVQNSPDIIYTLDENGNFLFINDAFERLLGYPRDGILGRHYTTIVDSSDRERSNHVFNERRTGDRASSGVELRLIPAHGNGDSGKAPEEPLPFELKAHGMYDRDAQVREKTYLGTYGFARDIRERKLLEAQVQRSEKLEALGRLAGGIAHDFNNYLTMILGNIELIRLQKEECGEALQRLDFMAKASERARELTQQLITFSRGGSPVKKAGSLSDVVRDASLFALRGSNVRCTFSFPKDLWLVDMDAGQIGQVLQNLVMNADQAMPEGGVVRIRTENVLIRDRHRLPIPSGRYVMVTVEDTGHGIPEEYLSKVFEPFFTLRKDGTGLGLATSYSIMKKHGGWLDVQSRVGIGTMFSLYLPASEGEEQSRSDVDQEVRRGSGRILAMDDEEQVRDLYTRMLSHVGYDVVAAADGDEAVRVYQEAHGSDAAFDLVIVDLTVPGTTGGKEAVSQLLEIDPNATVVVSSGYSDDPVMADFAHHGFRDAILKPFTLAGLASIVEKAIGKSG